MSDRPPDTQGHDPESCTPDILDIWWIGEQLRLQVQQNAGEEEEGA